jgi:hypothetical protein
VITRAEKFEDYWARAQVAAQAADAQLEAASGLLAAAFATGTAGGRRAVVRRLVILEGARGRLAHWLGPGL